MKYSKKMVLVDLEDKRRIDEAKLSNARSFDVRSSVMPMRNPNHGDFDHDNSREKLSAIDVEIMKILKSKRMSASEKVLQYGYLVKKYLQTKNDSQALYEQQVAKANEDISRKVAALMNINNNNNQNNSINPQKSFKQAQSEYAAEVSNLLDAISKACSETSVYGCDVPVPVSAASIDGEAAFGGFDETEIEAFNPRRGLPDAREINNDDAITDQQCTGNSSFFTPNKKATSTPSTTHLTPQQQASLQIWTPLIDQIITRSMAKKRKTQN